jgi:16S rRNA (guanine966-N2)-methyltransferase
MRVIAGKAKGHRLKAPKDASITRPATDLIREAIFSILENRVSDWAEVLDLFSGSGTIDATWEFPLIPANGDASGI